jgi:hypothetical protein
MNLIVLISLLFFSSFALTNEKPFELTADNLTLLALKNSPDQVINDYALSLLKSNNTKKYFQIRNDEEQLNALLKIQKSELILKLAKVPNKSHYTFIKKVKFSLNKESSSSINVGYLFPTVAYSILRSYKINNGLPDYFDLLFANLNILSAIKVEEKLLNKLLASKNKELYIEVNLIISNYQNQQDFQVVINEIYLFLDKNKKILLASVKENKSYETIVKNWLLSGGLSTKLSGVHAFSLFGYRIQDTIRKSTILDNSCEKTGAINNHIVLTCKTSYTENSLLISVYVGGILAQLDLIANKNISKKEAMEIINHTTIGLNKPRHFFSGVDKKWNKHFVDFSFSPNALEVTNTNQQESNINLNTNQYKLVFSMTSQSIKKMFQGIK